MNFAAAHIFFLYPKKLSYSSRNAYIKKIRARDLGKASRLLKSFKNITEKLTDGLSLTPVVSLALLDSKSVHA